MKKGELLPTHRKILAYEQQGKSHQWLANHFQIKMSEVLEILAMARSLDPPAKLVASLPSKKKRRRKGPLPYVGQHRL